MAPRHPFDLTFRSKTRERLAAFARTPLAGPNHALKRAAVAITLLPVRGATGFLLTRRAEQLRAHGGQWALPGGRCDDGEGYVDAALREVREEVGLELDAGDVLGVLDDYPTRSGYLITPVVLWAADDRRLRANPHEVASLHRIALDQIARPDAVDFTSIEQSSRRVVRIRIDGRFIHAPTAAILYQFREVLEGRSTRVSELEQPLFAWR
jgi:8-oxo-dGTP pyrophosphatase MutT (NUDIX family)